MAFSCRGFNALKNRIFAFVTGRENVHFLHLRKSGGTSIKSTLKEHCITPGFVIYLHPHRVKLWDVPKGHRIFFATRDPVSRFISGFGSRQRQGAPAHHVPWSESEALAFSRFGDVNSLALALEPSHPKHAEALHAMQHITHIQCSYWDWFGDEERLAAREDSILAICRTESLSDDFDLVRKCLGLPLDVVLPSDAKAANKAIEKSPKASVLEPKAIKLVKEWYRRDYDFLAYCEQWRQRHGGVVAR